MRTLAFALFITDLTLADPSSLRGFFAEPPMDARTQGLGGAGATLLPDALALMFNPAALGGLTRPSLLMARKQSPDGISRLSAAFALPARRRFTPGIALNFFGDGLASEGTASFGTAYGLGGLFPRFEGVLVGGAGKLYYAQAGEEGLGLDRSRGHSGGFGLDFGTVIPVKNSMRLAFAFRDLPGMLWHKNDFTGESYSETLPPEFRAAASARAGEDLEVFMEGHRGLFDAAPVHIRAGAEQSVFRILRGRAGYHQIFGLETVRRFSVGVGLDTRGLRPHPSLALNFAFEYGLGDHEALASSEQFALEARF